MSDVCDDPRPSRRAAQRACMELRQSRDTRCDGTTDDLRRIARDLCAFVEPEKRVIVFDFDGVVHRCVGPPTSSGQVHPLFFRVDELLAHDCRNDEICDLIRSHRAKGDFVAIVSNNTALGVSGIRALLRKWKVVVDDVRVCSGNKVPTLKKLGANVFYDDSANKVAEARRGMPELNVIHYQTPSRDAGTTLGVASYNVCWEAMRPTETGFGALGVACRRDVDTCRANVFDAIRRANADVVALQEVPSNMFAAVADEFDREYHLDLFEDRARFGPEGQVTMWRRGDPRLRDARVEHHMFERGRPYTIVHFDGGLHLINLHAGHGYELEYFEDTLTRTLKPSMSPGDSVIVAGDFNRDVHALRLGTTRVVCGARRPLKTCCTQKARAKYTIPCDHILSNLPFHKKTQRRRATFPASDHAPIAATLLA